MAQWQGACAACQTLCPLPDLRHFPITDLSSSRPRDPELPTWCRTRRNQDSEVWDSIPADLYNAIRKEPAPARSTKVCHAPTTNRLTRRRQRPDSSTFLNRRRLRDLNGGGLLDDPETSQGYPETSPGYPETSQGYPQTSQGYPEASQGYPWTGQPYPWTSQPYP